MAINRFSAIPKDSPPSPDGRYLAFWVDDAKEQAEIAKFSEKDARAYPKYVEYWDRVLDVIEPAMMAPPMPIADFFQTLPSGDAEPLLRDLFLKSASDFLDDWFESPELKGALSSSAVIGTFAGPYTPGTAYILGHHNIGTLEGYRRVWGQMKGGMGAITQAIAESARRHGAEIVTGAGVRRILLEHGRAVAVETDEGSIHRSRVVASSVDAQTTLLKFLPPDTLDPTVESKIRRIKARGACLKFNAALERLPRFEAAPNSGYLAGAIDIAPSME